MQFLSFGFQLSLECFWNRICLATQCLPRSSVSSVSTPSQHETTWKLVFSFRKIECLNQVYYRLSLLDWQKSSLEWKQWSSWPIIVYLIRGFNKKGSILVYLKSTLKIQAFNQKQRCKKWKIHISLNTLTIYFLIYFFKWRWTACINPCLIFNQKYLFLCLARTICFVIYCAVNNIFFWVRWLNMLCINFIKAIKLVVKHKKIIHRKKICDIFKSAEVKKL